MSLTPEEIKQNRLELAYCDILSEMDNALSYTMQEDRYDIWTFGQGQFKRVYVAMDYAESQRLLDEESDVWPLVFVAKHVSVDHCEEFLLSMAQAGLNACKLVELAKDKATDAPAKPRRTKAAPSKSKPRTKRKAVA